MNRNLIEALEGIEKEKGISRAILIDAIETALALAYKRDQKAIQSLEVRLDEATGDFHVFTHKTVVEEVEDDKNEISLAEAQKINAIYELNDLVEFEIFPKDFGRIAAQTAKQVVVQRIREAERGMIYEEYINRVGDLITGVVQRNEQRSVFLDLGRIEGILPQGEQTPNEVYEAGTRVKTFIVEVKKNNKGPQVILSRARSGLVKRLFELEVPEIQDGLVEIKSISREPGFRSKVAVYSRDSQIDAVGACVGSRGLRVQMIVRELKGEKIDIVPWSADIVEFIVNALSPSKVTDVKLLTSKKTAIVIVPDYQLSLAIGKEGQNARLAAKLTNWKIDIKSETQAEEKAEEIERLLAEEAAINPIKATVEETEQSEEEIDDFEEEYVEEYDETVVDATNSTENDSEETFEDKDDEDEEDEDEEKIVVKKKSKKNKPAKVRVNLEEELADVAEDDHYFFADVLDTAKVAEESEKQPKAKAKGKKKAETTEEDDTGFTIGQLLGEELMKKTKKTSAKKEAKK